MTAASTATRDPISRLFASLDSMFESATSLRRSSANLSAASVRLQYEATELARKPALFELPKQRLMQERDRALQIARDADDTVRKIARSASHSGPRHRVGVLARA